MAQSCLWFGPYAPIKGCSASVAQLEHSFWFTFMQKEWSLHEPKPPCNSTNKWWVGTMRRFAGCENHTVHCFEPKCSGRQSQKCQLSKCPNKSTQKLLILKHAYCVSFQPALYLTWISSEQGTSKFQFESWGFEDGISATYPKNYPLC